MIVEFSVGFRNSEGEHDIHDPNGVEQAITEYVDSTVSLLIHEGKFIRLGQVFHFVKDYWTERAGETVVAHVDRIDSNGIVALDCGENPVKIYMWHLHMIEHMREGLLTHGHM